MGEMRVMDILEGDIKIIWDSENDDEIDAAREQFNKLTKKGFIAYSVKKGGAAGERVKEFDPDIEKLILAPTVKGWLIWFYIQLHRQQPEIRYGRIG
jgi:hypothetical protein